jgi:phage terminase large subunit
VDYGIRKMTNEMQQGNLLICSECKNLIKEVQGYVWDSKKAKLGIDAPLKTADHAIDAMRYAIATHKVSNFNEEDYYRKQEQESRSRLHPGGYGFR